MKGPRPKKIPQRTCVACKQERPKRELVRIVRTLAGTVEVDPTGKKAGRGAYLCRSRACWNAALKKKSIEHALQTQVGPENKAVLAEFAEGLPAEDQ